MTTVLITGGNTGLGKEAALLLARRTDIDRVIITARDPERGAQALDDLCADAAGTAEFQLYALDTTEPESVAQLADELPAIDIAVLNAGGVTGSSALDVGGYGVTNIMAANVVGHADLVERLIAAGKLTERAILVSSEAARGVKALRIKPPAVDTGDRAAVNAVMTGRDPEAAGDLLYMYANVKLLGSLWAAAAARRHPELTIVSVSPGSTRGTEAPRHMPFPMNKMMPMIMRVVMPLFGASHALSVGAQRYVDAAVRPDIDSGGFYASPAGKISGDLVDQRADYPLFASIADQEVVYEAIRSLTTARA